MNVTKTKTTTWLGIRGEAWDFLKTTDSRGERVSALRWLEDNPNTGNKAGDLVLRHMRGDLRKGNFVVYGEVTLTDGTDPQAQEWAEWKLSPSGHLPLSSHLIVLAANKAGLEVTNDSTGGGCEQLTIQHPDGGHYGITNGDAQVPGFEYESGETDWDIWVIRYDADGVQRSLEDWPNGDDEGWVYGGDDEEDAVKAILSDIPTPFTVEAVSA